MFTVFNHPPAGFGTQNLEFPSVFFFHFLSTCLIMADIAFLLPAQVKDECYAAKFNQVFVFLSTFMLM